MRMSCIRFLCLVLGLLIDAVHMSLADLHAPCYACEFHHFHKDQPTKAQAKRDVPQEPSELPTEPPTSLFIPETPEQEEEIHEEGCPAECHCDERGLPKCMDGVPRVSDGCCPCLVCARLQGENCDKQFPCDDERDLYCDYRRPVHGKGICRAKMPKPCLVEGHTYADGQEFQIGCKRLCTCQDGNYACVSLCPHEDFKPSRAFCEVPVLVSIPGRCCKEWACQQEKQFPRITISPTMPSPSEKERPCNRVTTRWEPCSVTCGMGVSVRLTNDNKDCMSIKQQRLCYLRPCAMNDSHLRGHECKSTWKSFQSFNLEYQDCVSVKSYRPKLCSTCKRNRCCTPDITKTITVDFKCSGHKETIMNFMWIKSCRCHKRCAYHHRKLLH